MTRSSRYLLPAVLVALAGCAALDAPAPEEEPPLHGLYDRRIVDGRTGQSLALPELATELANADVVFIGEFHGHNGAHLLQAQLQQALYRQHPNQVLTMEQFTVDHQPELDRYLRGESGEAEMEEDADAWPNYRASYRPLINFAITHDLPVVAANAPAHLVRCVGRLGPDYLASLPPEQQAYLPADPFFGTEAYRRKFLDTMGGGRHGSGDPTHLLNSYRAQLLRDNTMASRIANALAQYPGAQVIHTNGTFHSENRLGTVAALQAMEPELQIQVITPVLTNEDGMPASPGDDLGKGDYLYYILPLPMEYLDQERQMQAMMKQFRQASEQDCET